MAIDPRIALGVQPIQIQSPLEVANQIAGLRDAEQRNALVQRQIQAQERALTEQNALRRRVSSPDFFKQPNALESLVGEFGQTGADLAKAITDARKSESDSLKAERERKIEESRQLFDILGVGIDDDSWTQVYNQAKQAGFDLTNVPEKFNPLWSKNAQRSALGYVKFLENEREDEKLGVQKGELKLSQDRLAFERNQEAWKRANPEYELKETALGYVAVNKRNPSDTKMVMIDGKPATGAVSQKATEDQLKTAYNADRMLSAGDVIGRALQENPSAEKPGFFETVVGSTPFIKGAVNFVRDDQRQQIAAAQVQLADALLYLATGAAYNELQYTNNQNAVIPAFSDGAPAIKTKRKLFLDQVAAAKRRSAAAWTPEHEAIYKDMLKMYDTPLAPPPGALKELQADPSPEARKEFDEEFGPGAADKVLNPKK
jgi:hypothetical protein